MNVDIRRILDVLPHRYPFLLVDRVEDIVARQSAVGFKNVTINEPFFQGHFPGNPVMPGVLIIEAMAQVGAVLLLHDHDEDMKDKYIYLAGADRARFRRPVVPGDQLRMELEIQSLRSRSCKMLGRASVAGKLAAEAELLSMMVDLSEEKKR